MIHKKAKALQRYSAKKGGVEVSNLNSISPDDYIWEINGIHQRFKAIYQLMAKKCEGTNNKYEIYVAKRKSANRFEFRLNEFNDLFCYFDGKIRNSMIPRHSDNVYMKDVVCDVTDDESYNLFIKLINLPNGMEKGFYHRPDFKNKSYDIKKYNKLSANLKFSSKWGNMDKEQYVEEYTEEFWSVDTDMTYKECKNYIYQKLTKKYEKKEVKKEKKEEEVKEVKKEKYHIIKKKKSKKKKE